MKGIKEKSLLWPPELFAFFRRFLISVHEPECPLPLIDENLNQVEKCPVSRQFESCKDVIQYTIMWIIKKYGSPSGLWKIWWRQYQSLLYTFINVLLKRSKTNHTISKIQSNMASGLSVIPTSSLETCDRST